MFKTFYCNNTINMLKKLLHSFVVFNSYSGISCYQNIYGPNSEIGIRRIIGLHRNSNFNDAV
jgi:hypothetical protein